MANPVGKLSFKVVSILIGIPVGILTRKAVAKAWMAARPEDPPREPSDPKVSWGDAIGWAALTAVGTAAAELATTKGAATIWWTITGHQPPTAKDESKADKKAAKKSKKNADSKSLSPAGALAAR